MVVSSGLPARSPSAPATTSASAASSWPSAPGIEVALRRRVLEGLVRAKPAGLAPIEISPSGLGLHDPELAAGLYLPALLDGVFGSRRHMAAAMSVLPKSSPL